MDIDSSLGLNFFFWAIFDLGIRAEVWVESVEEEERSRGKRKRKRERERGGSGF